MGTLPRTKSLSGADTSSLSRSFRERTRPTSLCEASWNKIYPSSGLPQDRLTRTPSQANNLCTTVPTSIVNKTLGGRHTPTRNSLRHSRMAVMARNGKGAAPVVPRRRKMGPDGFGRVVSLIILAYILVGVVGGLLAVWLVKWAPSLPFKEIPHYAAGLIIANGIIATVLFHCLPKHRKGVTKFLKVLLVVLLLVCLLSCACVCIFDILHLINLAPMECTMRNDVIIHPAPGKTSTNSTSASTPTRGLKRMSSPDVNKLDRMSKFVISEAEGSGDGAVGDDEEYGVPVEEELELETRPLSSFEAKIKEDIYVNVSVCVCHKVKKGWRIVAGYSKLSCEEVKNILPIFLVASCVVCVVGVVLSAVILYIVWTFPKRQDGPYRVAGNPAEAQPFVSKSDVKVSQDSSRSHTGKSANGGHPNR